MNKDNTLKLTKVEIEGTEEQSSNLILPKSVEIDGEQVDVPEEGLVITWIDLVKGEAHNPLRVDDLQVPVSDRVTQEYHPTILENLRMEIANLKAEEGYNPNKGYRREMLRYHPDLYRGQDEKTQDLAEQYAKAIQAIRENGEFEKDLSRQETIDTPLAGQNRGWRARYRRTSKRP